MTEPSTDQAPLYFQQQGEGPVLLLVHGFPLDHTMWRWQLAGLAESYRVIAPDLRGFGQSQVTPGTVTMSEMADDLASLLDWLGIHQPICLCGLSMGGYVAWEFWRRHCDRLSRLILCDTRAAADTTEVARGRLLMAQVVEATGIEQVVESLVPKLLARATHQQQPQLVAELRQTIVGTNPLAFAAAQRGMAQRPAMTDRLSEIQLPTLALCGEHDVISGPAEMQQIARALPHGRFVPIPDAGHMSPLEQPQKVNSAILEFLRGNGP